MAAKIVSGINLTLSWKCTMCGGQFTQVAANTAFDPSSTGGIVMRCWCEECWKAQQVLDFVQPKRSPAISAETLSKAVREIYSVAQFILSEFQKEEKKEP